MDPESRSMFNSGRASDLGPADLVDHPFQGPVVGGPMGFAALLADGAEHDLKLAIQVIEVMNDEGLGRLG